MMTAVWQDYSTQKAMVDTAIPGIRACTEKHKMLWGCGARYRTAVVINTEFLRCMLEMHENYNHASAPK